MRRRSPEHWLGWDSPLQAPRGSLSADLQEGQFLDEAIDKTNPILEEKEPDINSVHDGIKSKYKHSKQINGILECTWLYKCIVCLVEYLTKKQMEEHVSLIHKIHEFHHCNICSEYFMKDS